MNHFEENPKRIEGELFRREWNKNIGRFIESYLIPPNPKMDDRGWTKKDLNFLYIEMVDLKQRLSCART